MIKILFRTFLFAVILSLVGVPTYFYLQHREEYPSTSNAYLQANIVQITPRVSGMLTQVLVSNHEKVKKGELLFTIDSKPYEIALNKAKAVLNNTEQKIKASQAAITAAQSIVNQREAELVAASNNYHRTMTLVKKHLASVASGDQATSNYHVAQAVLAAAKGKLNEAKQTLGEVGKNNALIKIAKDNVEQAKLNLQYTKVFAPSDGYIAKLTLVKGQVVTAFEPLFNVIENHSWWVDANYKENHLARIKPGQSADIRIDMYPGHVFKGVVANISENSGSSFSLLPAENASGNWVKVTQRFPVRINIINPNPHYPLRFGASCSVTIKTN